MNTIEFKYAYVDYVMYESENGLYLDLFSLKQLFDISDEETKQVIDENEKLLSHIRKLSIEIEYLPYYDINIILHYAIEKNPEVAEAIYSVIKEKNKEDVIDSELIAPLEKIHSLSKPSVPWEKLDDVFYTMDKVEDNTYKRLCSYCNRIALYDLFPFIDEVKERYSLGKDFGEFEDYDKAEKVFEDAFENMGEERKSKEWYGAKLFYNIYTSKPYKKDNDKLALIALYVFLYENKMLYDDFDVVYSSVDFMNILSVMKESKDSTEEEMIERLIPLLSVSEKRRIRKSEKDLEIYKKNPTRENVIRYIVSYLEENHYHQGYYEYFSSKNKECLKLRYRGYHYNLRLNYTESMERKALVFDTDALAYIEAPTLLAERNGFVINRFEEIKERNKKDIIEQIHEDIKKKLGKEFDMKSITIEINPTWHIKSDLDYDY